MNEADAHSKVILCRLVGQRRLAALTLPEELQQDAAILYATMNIGAEFLSRKLEQRK